MALWNLLFGEHLYIFQEKEGYFLWENAWILERDSVLKILGLISILWKCVNVISDIKHIICNQEVRDWEGGAKAGVA